MKTPQRPAEGMASKFITIPHAVKLSESLLSVFATNAQRIQSFPLYCHHPDHQPPMHTCMHCHREKTNEST